MLWVNELLSKTHTLTHMYPYCCHLLVHGSSVLVFFVGYFSNCFSFAMIFFLTWQQKFWRVELACQNVTTGNV